MGKVDVGRHLQRETLDTNLRIMHRFFKTYFDHALIRLLSSCRPPLHSDVRLFRLSVGPSDAHGEPYLNALVVDRQAMIESDAF